MGNLINKHFWIMTLLLLASTVEVRASENVSDEGVTVDLAAKNIKFDKTTITVPAGANVTMNFDNQESVPHNFALYENSSAENVIFKGEVITGPKTIVYTFDAPDEPGTYFFRCDIHPRGMTGQFIVE
jgi:plastocyanin